MDTKKYPLNAINDIGRLSPDGILLYNLSENRVEYTNKALSKILEIGKDELMDVSALRNSVLDENKLIQDQLQALKANSHISNVELRIRSMDNKYISCDAYLIAEAKVIVTIVKDITVLAP